MPEYKLSYEIREKIATFLFLLGIKYGASMDIAENTSLGYGNLDNYGFWQYPITCSSIKKLVFVPFWKFKSIYHSLFVLSIDYVTPYIRDPVIIKGKRVFKDRVISSRLIIQFPLILKKEYKHLRNSKWLI